jgi:uncharacterized protein
MSSSTSTTTTLTDLLVPTYRQNLKNLAKWLDKIPAEKVEELLHQRLAPDMFPLATQIRFVSFQAREAVYRLQAREIPGDVLEVAKEGRTLGSAALETEKDTLEAARARIQEALDFLDSLEPDALDQNDRAKKMLALELPDAGITFDLNGEQFVRDWALPQFYFHIVVAYSILRNAGIELGKADYVPHMFAYLRPPAPPTTKEED